MRNVSNSTIIQNLNLNLNLFALSLKYPTYVHPHTPVFKFVNRNKNCFIHSHLLFCPSYVRLCIAESRTSPIFKTVEEKLKRLLSRISDSPYEGLTAEDIIAAILIWTAETPIAFYRLVTMPFNISGKRDPQAFKFQKRYMKLLILSHRFLMTIPELCYTGPVYRGLDISKSVVLQKQFDDYKNCFAHGVVKKYPAPTSTSFNDEKVRRQAKPNRFFD